MVVVGGSGGGSGGFFLVCEDVGEMFTHSFPASPPFLLLMLLLKWRLTRANYFHSSVHNRRRL